ncbi:MULTISPECIES: hypothetical protein [Moorena]|uniref:hypothetical protein n=1 Tax=Moorena TaxID=1155738 RepID=UPI0012B60D2A|nr:MULTISPECIES: hypothetical protein [Moorena]NEP31043.1 hypothetical protein [Moorena sp. SIO3B2]NEP66323.1 hypothetical protein [Moorena sp. SIO3A5]NEQ11631.1 hypothetical protein [Moorena sp. SIO4E2]
MTLVPPKVGGLGGQNSVSKNLGDILLTIPKITKVSIQRSAVSGQPWPKGHATRMVHAT